jgi:membrane protein
MALNQGIEPQSSSEAVSQNPWWQRGVAGIVRSAYRSWFAHRTIRFGAGLAYYGLFAAVPLVAVALFVAGLIFSQQDVGQYVATQIEPVVGANAAMEVAGLLDGLQEDISNSLGGIVLFVVTVVAASFVFVALQDGINIVWEAPRRRGLEAGLKRRLLAVGLVLLGAAALAVGLIASVILGGISDALSSRGFIDAVADVVSSLLSALILGVVVLAIFKYLPNVAVGWPSAVIASIVTTAVLFVGTWLVAMYLENFSGISLAGATSALLGLLAWLYLEAQILLAGAELNRAIEQRDTPAAVDSEGQRPHGAGPTHPRTAD